MSVAKAAAEATEPRPATVASPCNSVCSIDAATGWCAGCMRSIDEIAAWGALDDASRARVLQSLPARRAAFDRGKEGAPRSMEHERCRARGPQ